MRNHDADDHTFKVQVDGSKYIDEEELHTCMETALGCHPICNGKKHLSAQEHTGKQNAENVHKAFSLMADQGYITDAQCSREHENERPGQKNIASGRHAKK